MKAFIFRYKNLIAFAFAFALILGLNSSINYLANQKNYTENNYKLSKPKELSLIIAEKTCDSLVGYKKADCFKELALKNSSPNICALIKTDRSSGVKDSCYIKLSEKLKDVRLCERVEVVKWKASCISVVAQSLGSPKLCKKIDYDYSQRLCYFKTGAYEQVPWVATTIISVLVLLIYVIFGAKRIVKGNFATKGFVVGSFISLLLMFLFHPVLSVSGVESIQSLIAVIDLAFFIPFHLIIRNWFDIGLVEILFLTITITLPFYLLGKGIDEIRIRKIRGIIMLFLLLLYFLANITLFYLSVSSMS